MKLKRIARVSFDRFAVLSGLTALSESGMRRGLSILTYHRVLPDAMCADYLFPSLAVPESMFRGQMATLARRCKVVSLDEGVQALRAGQRTDRPMVAITFDDGYSDNIRLAAPVMNALGLRATFFVVAGLIGTDGELWYDVAARRWSSASAAELTAAVRVCAEVPDWTDAKPSIERWMSLLKRISPSDRARVVDALQDPGREPSRQHLDRLMTPDDLRDLHGKGHVIGSHTMTHPLLPQLDHAGVEHELVRSKQLLQDWIQSDVTGFCYPNGDHDDDVVAAVRAAGYATACTTQSGRNGGSADPLRLRRIDMHPSRSSGVVGQFDEPSFRATISLLHARRHAS